MPRFFLLLLLALLGACAERRIDPSSEALLAELSKSPGHKSSLLAQIEALRAAQPQGASRGSAPQLGWRLGAGQLELEPPQRWQLQAWLAEHQPRRLHILVGPADDPVPLLAVQRAARRGELLRGWLAERGIAASVHYSPDAATNQLSLSPSEVADHD